MPNSGKFTVTFNITITDHYIISCYMQKDNTVYLIPYQSDDVIIEGNKLTVITNSNWKDWYVYVVVGILNKL